MGISKEDKDQLFKPYFKSQNKESNEKNNSSHGLGLNICKRIAARLGGDLKHDDKLTQGCQFVFTFKADVAPYDPELPEHSNGKSQNLTARFKTRSAQ